MAFTEIWRDTSDLTWVHTIERVCLIQFSELVNLLMTLYDSQVFAVCPAGLPCRSSIRPVRCHAGTTTSPEALLSHGWASTRAASPQSKAASTSGML